MKKILYGNYRVIVEPCEPFLLINLNRKGQTPEEKKHEDMCSVTKSLMKEIQRHCDCESCDWEFDRKEVCSFCGSIWEDIDPNDPFFCCDKAQEEYEDNHCK